MMVGLLVRVAVATVAAAEALSLEGKETPTQMAAEAEAAEASRRAKMVEAKVLGQAAKKGMKAAQVAAVEEVRAIVVRAGQAALALVVQAAAKQAEAVRATEGTRGGRKKVRSKEVKLAAARRHS